MSTNDPRQLGDDAERRMIDERRKRIAALRPGSAERIAEKRDLALALTKTSAEPASSLETPGSPQTPPAGEDGRQSPRPDVLDAIRSLMMAPVADHRTRRKP